MNNIQKKLWETEQEILDVIHTICISNGLKYSLAYGTLLGAVRHEGFIPWDDDIDIFMPRHDYEKLKEIWNNEAPKEYLLQEPYTSSDVMNNFIKIRKDHTTFIQDEMECSRHYHKGIFVDIFPLDRLAPGFFRRKYQYLCCLLDLLYNRGYTSGQMNGKGRKFEFVEKMLLAIVPTKKYHDLQKIFERQVRKWNYDDSLELFCIDTIEDMRCHYEPDIFLELIELPFEGKKYFAFKSYKKVLEIEFGDYMKLPPVEERTLKHHPLIVDFERNYEEIIVSNRSCKEKG